MKEQLAELEMVFEALVEREGEGALIVSCTDVEVLYMAKTLTGLDERSEADLFLSFVAQAPTMAAFVETVVEHFTAQRTLVDEQRQRESVALLPPLPEVVRDSGAALELRMRALIDDALGLLPEGDHRLAFSLLPIELNDHESFSALVEYLLKEALSERLRLIVRDDNAAPGPIKLAESWPDETVLAYELAMKTDDLTAATAATAQDPEKPVAERMLALLQLAFLDYGYQRYEAAVAKFDGLSRYYDATGEVHFETLARAGIGDVQRAQGQLAEARVTYEEALLKVAPTHAFPVTLQVSTCLGDTCRELAQHSDAEGYYRLADRIATSLANLYAKMDIAESLGLCRLAQGEAEEAAAIWRDAADACRELDYAYRLAPILGHLADIHGEQLPDLEIRRLYLAEKEQVDERLKEEGFK